MSTTRFELHAALQLLMQPQRFKDYGPNGLQVEGKPCIARIVSGVTASRALIDAAIEHQADAIIVHHGLFWRGQDGCVTGWMKQRLQRLLAHDMNLWAYHLPLDAHPTLGNNAQWGHQLGWQVDGQFGEQDLGCTAAVDYACAQTLADHVRLVTRRDVTLVPTDNPVSPIHKVAWCTGGAQSYFEAAIAQGVDAFITGEISEPQAHLAREMGVAYIAAGHHATERYGAPALASCVANQLGIEHIFIDIDNPA